MSSTNATVTCTSATAKFEFNRIENIHISGMTFQGCRNGAAVQMTTGTQAIIIRNNFIRNGAGAVQMTSVTRVVVINSNFTANQGNSLQISNSELVTVNKSSFSENHGNCLSAISSSLVIINENRFYNNGRAYSYTGRAVYAFNSMVVISKSFFNNNTNRANGGAIYAYNSNITVDSSEFSNNTVTGTSYSTTSSGGAIYVFSENGDFELQINDTVFFGNRAYQGHGGAIYVYIIIYVIQQQV